MLAGTGTLAQNTSTESLSLDNLQLSDLDDDAVTKDLVNKESSCSRFHADSRTPRPTSPQPNRPASVRCSPHIVRQQTEGRLLLHDLSKARTRGDRQQNGSSISHSIGTLDRVQRKMRPFSAVNDSSTSFSSFDERTFSKKRPATSLGKSSGSFSVPSTISSTSSAHTSIEHSSPFSPGSGSRKKMAPKLRHVKRSTDSFCNRILSSTLVKGEEWRNRNNRDMFFDPILQKVTVHIANYRNPAAEQVTLSMSYSSSATNHNSNVFTDDLLRLHGRKERLTRVKVHKVEQRLEVQRRCRINMAWARSVEMQRAAKLKDPPARTTKPPSRLTAPSLLSCDLASARLDRIRSRTSAVTHANTNAHLYMLLNEDR